MDGPIETARQGNELDVVDERKVDQVVAELERYNVDVAGIQEVKWFGCGVYRVAESVVIAAGRPVPSAGVVKQRGEGVAIVLSGQAVKAWNSGGSRWKAWSSRLVSAALKIGSNGIDVLHVVSCYAPPFAASREEKDKFYSMLQEVLSSIPSQEHYVLLGDFNAHVGSRNKEDEWWHERGPHGLGVLNDAGRELLSFCSVNGATVCTDHRMLWMKMKIGKKFSRRGTKERLVKRFDVAKLQGQCEDVELPKGKFVSGVCESLKRNWNQTGTAHEKWIMMRNVMCSVARSVLGQAERREADWFRESEDVLRPLFEKRSRLFNQWLCSGKIWDKRKFVEARRIARKAVRDVKNRWFQTKAAEASAGRNGGKVVWKCIRDIQRSRRGLVPVRVTVVKDEDGRPCTTPESQQQRWQQHFMKVLNVQSLFTEDEVDRVRHRQVREEMAEPPNEEELLDAVMKLRNGKAAGESGILPEMVKAACCDGNFVEMLLELVTEVWTESGVPADWSDTVLIPIPKKGDLSQCDNWRGIALLDVVGKVVARVIQGRLQKLAEDELPESQCGFRKGRGCMDMVFSVRQLVEKSWEHKEKLFITFVDLKKAYDSVPREAMWTVLRKLGVLDMMISLIKSFHQDMKARIHLDGKLMDPISVRNGLRQGCCMAPVLFDLFTCAVMERWLEKAQEADGEVGVRLLYKYDGKLFRRYRDLGITIGSNRYDWLPNRACVTVLQQAIQQDRTGQDRTGVCVCVCVCVCVWRHSITKNNIYISTYTKYSW